MTVINESYDLVPVGDLQLHPDNPRVGDVDTIVDSIGAHGFYGAIVAQKSTGYVLAGNHRLAAARKQGIASVPVTWVDVDEEQARRILVADNRTSDLGTYDESLLIELLESLPDLYGTGYSPEDLETLLALNASPEHDGDLQDILDEADASAWPWVKAQLPPDVYALFQTIPGEDDAARVTALLTIRHDLEADAETEVA